LAGDSCAAIEKTGLIGVNSSYDTAIKENSIKGVETKKNDLVLVRRAAL
jgi:hypothetical protein